MANRPLRVAAALLAAASLSACASTVVTRPDYVSAGLAAPVLQGRAVIVMDDAFRGQTLTVHPTSFTGSATTIIEPIGPVVAAVGEKIFDVGFSGGSAVAAQPGADAYNVALRLDGFSYAYDQLSSLGFAITPKVTVTLTADARAPDGRALVHKAYSRQDFTVGAYAISTQPAEKINQGLHLALGEIFREMLDDIKAADTRP
jgi:hypothetical protein